MEIDIKFINKHFDKIKDKIHPALVDEKDLSSNDKLLFVLINDKKLMKVYCNDLVKQLNEVLSDLEKIPNSEDNDKLFFKMNEIVSNFEDVADRKDYFEDYLDVWNIASLSLILTWDDDRSDKDKNS